MAKLQTEPILVPGNKLGIQLNFPEQFLDKAMSPYSRNIEYVNGVLSGRSGMAKFDTTQLKGNVMLMEQFTKFNGDSYFITCTNKDIMYYDFSNTRFVYLNKLYQTGLAKMGTGADVLKVFGSGTSWLSEVSVGDYFKWGTGDLYSDSTWYEIATVDTGTQVTLITAPTGSTYAAYTIRKLFTGQTGSSVSDFWSTTIFQDVTLGETWVATNGVDVPVRWTGSGQVVDINTASGMTAAKYVSQFKDRLFYLNTTEGGEDQPQRARWTGVANIATNNSADFTDFMENQSPITGAVEFNNYFAIFKEDGARIGRYVGGDYTFDFEVSSVPAGCRAPNSIINNGDDIYYYGSDGKFHRWNFLREEDVSTDILPWTKDFDPNLDTFIFGYPVPSKNQIRWFVPHGTTSYNNYVVVFDYEQEIMEIWDTGQEQALCSMGEYITTSDEYFDDAILGEEYFDEQIDYFDDQTNLDASSVLVYGGYDGYIREADSGTQDDGEDYTRIFRTKRLDFRYPVLEKRLWKQEWAFNTQTSGSTVSLYMKKGDNTTDETETKSIDLTSTTKDVIRPEVTWDKTDYTFQFELKSTSHFELLGFLNHWFPKGKTFR
jgi:hypothetical protein